MTNGVQLCLLWDSYPLNTMKNCSAILWIGWSSTLTLLNTDSVVYRLSVCAWYRRSWVRFSCAGLSNRSAEESYTKVKRSSGVFRFLMVVKHWSIHDLNQEWCVSCMNHKHLLDLGTTDCFPYAQDINDLNLDHYLLKPFYP